MSNCLMKARTLYVVLKSYLQSLAHPWLIAGTQQILLNKFLMNNCILYVKKIIMVKVTQ